MSLELDEHSLHSRTWRDTLVLSAFTFVWSCVLTTHKCIHTHEYDLIIHLSELVASGFFFFFLLSVCILSKEAISFSYSSHHSAMSSGFVSFTSVSCNSLHSTYTSYPSLFFVITILTGSSHNNSLSFVLFLLYFVIVTRHLQTAAENWTVHSQLLWSTALITPQTFCLTSLSVSYTHLTLPTNREV